jgi:hypothetical protein
MIGTRSTISVVVFLTLASCATPASLFLRAPASPLRENGYILFSITGSGLAGAARRLCLSLHLRGISNAVTKKVTSCMADWLLPGSTASAKSRAAGRVIGKADPMGKMVLIELPPGEYEFDDYEGAEASFDDDMHYSSPPGFEYKFDVASTKINYLGDLNFALTWQIESRQISGLNFTPTRALGMNFQVLDQQDRDAPLFDTEFPAYSQKEKIWCDGCALHNP